MTDHLVALLVVPADADDVCSCLLELVVRIPESFGLQIHRQPT